MNWIKKIYHKRRLKFWLAIYYNTDYNCGFSLQSYISSSLANARHHYNQLKELDPQCPKITALEYEATK